MTLTKEMKDRITVKLLDRAVPPEELEELKEKLKELLEADTGCRAWEDMKSCAKKYPELAYVSDIVELQQFFGDGWYADRLEVVIPEGYAPGETRFSPPHVRFTKENSENGRTKVEPDLDLPEHVMNAVEKLYDWSRRYRSMKSDLEALMASTSSSMKIIGKVPEAKDLIEAEVEAKKEADGKMKKDTSEWISAADLDFVNTVFTEKGGRI